MDSGLVGRGGAAFPMGRKWDAVARQPRRPHYLICNADESEPGTFKDRVLMEGDPFAVVEAMTIAAYATGCEHGYLYVRGEYPLARDAHRATRSSWPASAASSGRDILGQGFSFDIEIRKGAGAYICGEETAVFGSIEGYRGEPRNKPPFPVVEGLFQPSDGGQQRRDARQRAADRARGRPGLRADRHREVHRAQALLRLGRRRDAGDLRGPVRDDAARAARAGRRGVAATCRPCSWAAPPAASSPRTTSTCA